MPSDTLSFLQRLQEYGIIQYAIMIAMGFWAGTVKYLMSLNGHRGKIKDWLIESFVCMFVGVITFMVGESYIESQTMLIAISTLSAHNGTRSLYLIGQILKKNTPILNQMIDEPTKVKLANRKGDQNGTSNRNS